jgi:uncharacterized repeat protein (TIGR03837 family)
VLQRWDIFCRVIDNLGDVGVCWRLAADLATRGCTVRLVIDDPTALAWMAPQGAAGVQVHAWPGPPEPADAVVEAFGCDPPEAYVTRLALRRPLWINLEYLSAEGYVERSHTLPSPQRGGLTKWFFFPGFTPRTGGLLREPGLLQRRAAFDRDRWLAQAGWPRRPGEQVVVLFSYANALIGPLLHELAGTPTLLLVPPGPAQAATPTQPTQRTQPRGALRVVHLPYLPQAAFDELLWSADLNLVRGEDSLVRALWAGAPLLWQAYPQHDGAHHAKVRALLAAAGVAGPHGDTTAAWHAWNGLPDASWPGLAALRDPSARHTWHAWREALLAQPDLTTQLLHFATQHPPGKP